MTNETNPTTAEPIYVRPTILSRFTMSPEEAKIESAIIESDGVRALCVFASQEDALEWRREAHHLDESMQAVRVENEHLRDLLKTHKCSHVVTPISFLGDGSVDLFTAEDFMHILEGSGPANRPRLYLVR